jgi:hypothetical protein
VWSLQWSSAICVAAFTFVAGDDESWGMGGGADVFCVSESLERSAWPDGSCLSTAVHRLSRASIVVALGML